MAVELGVAELAATRFAVSPLSETVLRPALHLLLAASMLIGWAEAGLAYSAR
jgi:hypothetical protein